MRTLLRNLLAIPHRFIKDMERSVVVQSLMQAKSNRLRSGIDSLVDVEFRGFSQWGEDGILDWLVERLPGIPESFIEFGVENYRESNTRLLLWLRNWRGLVIDGSPANIADIRQQEISWRFDIMAIQAFIDRDNINDLLSSGKLGPEIGILSIDIDGNDYWIWKCIHAVSPIIVVCEYNAVLGDLRRLTIPYRADFHRSRAHYSNLYFGASVNALIELGKEKGYSFVGTNSNGCNAFFVRNDRAQEILAGLEQISLYGSRIRESRNQWTSLSFLRGMSRLDPIRHLPIFDLDIDRALPLAELDEIYSESWKKLYG